MYENLGIRQHLRLVTKDQSEFSKECLDTASSRPEEFLGLLRHLWQFEGHIIRENETLMAKFETIVLPTLIETEDYYIDYTRAFLPVQSLFETYSRYLGSAFFPFIRLPGVKCIEDVTSDWSFLVKDLNIKCENNIDFQLALLEYFIDDKGTTPDSVDLEQLVDLYQSIDAHLTIASDKDEQKEKIRYEKRSLH
jgi:hypothetical protein